jgi:2-keto-4-pentenoate hydratase/2-oxohepta-3-ene-1,7-dioic acid hydratase in catechol pathway
MKADEPSEPVLFLKPPSSLIRNGGPILLPKDIGRVDHEAELALIIGKGGKGIRVEGALGHIGQLAVFNDVTARDMQSTAKAKGLPWALSKGIDTFSPMSDPRPSGEVDDLQDLDIELRVNGVTRQRGDTSQMIFGVPELVAYISRWMRLDEGDIIATGTPEGVGPIRPGDMVEIDISEVGRLSNPVRSL